MDPQDRNNLRCPCYDLRGEFQKIVDWKDSGLVIYRHTSQIESGTKKSEEKPTINNNEDKFVLHNTNNTDLLSADIVAALDKYGISCPRCAHIIKNAKRMLEIVPKVKSNHVMGICDHCRKKLATCIECNKVVKRYVTTRDENIVIKQRVKSYISNIHRLLTDVICEKKLFKDIRRELSDRDIFSIHHNSPKSTQELVIEDVFERQGMRSRLPCTSFDSIAAHSGLPRGKKRTVLFDSVNNEVVETKNDLFYSRSLENLTYYDNKLLADDANIRNDYEKRGSFSFGSDSSILKKYSKTGKISFVPDFQYKKSKIDNDKKRTLPNLKERYLSKSMPHIIKTESNDKSSQLSLRYHSEKDLINAVSNTMDDTLYSYFEYYFPKELDIKLKKPIVIISSSELISNTQNMLRDKAEKEKMRQEQDRIKKQEEKERQILEKIEKKKERLLAKEEARKRTEKDKKLAEEKKLIIIAEKPQVGALSSDDEEHSSEKLTHLKGKKSQSKSIAQVKDKLSEDSIEGKRKRNQSKEKVEKIKQKDDIEFLEHKQARKELNLVKKQKESDAHTPKTYEEYTGKKSKEGVDTTKEDKDGTKKEDKFERKTNKEDDDTIKKKKDKYENKRSEGGDDTRKQKEGIRIDRKQSKEKVEKIKQKDDIEFLEHKQAGKELNLVKKQKESDAHTPKSYEEYTGKKSKEGVDTTKKDKDGTKKEDKFERKINKEDDDTMKKKKDKYENKRSEGGDVTRKQKEGIRIENKYESKKSKGDDDTITPDKEETRKEDEYEGKRSKGNDDKIKPDKEGTRKEDKYESSRSKGNADTVKEKEGTKTDDNHERMKSRIDETPSKTDKQKHDDSLKNATDGDTSKEKAGKDAIDKQKDVNNAELTTKTSLAPKDKSEADTLEKKSALNKAAAEFKKLLAEQAKQKEIDRKQKKIQEEEEKKARADAEKKIGESAKLINSPRPKKPLKIIKTTNITNKVSPPSSPAQKFNEPTPKDISLKKIKMAEPSGDDLLLQLVKLHQSGPRRELVYKGEPNNQIRKLLARHRGHSSDKNMSCKICTDSDIQLELDSIVNKRDIDEIANIIIGEKIFKYKTPVNDNSSDQQISDFKAPVEESLETNKDDEILQVISEKIDSQMPIKDTTKGPKTVTVIIFLT